MGVGFRRLAILDLSPSGHQPMVSDDGRFILVFNGEIYNFVELRKDLSAAGYHFRSTGDSEVLLNAYRHWGTECLSRLNGMWAFLIYDRSNRRMFGSRDRFGVKPLFVHRNARHALFASEIKAIRASGYYRGGVNWKVASRFLVEGHLDDGLESFYEGIESIPPGSAFEIDDQGKWRTWQFWKLGEVEPADVQEPAARFAELFEDAVRLRMRSDVPVGVCLSGGLDSTSIICAASRQRAENKAAASGPLQAFCYMAKEFDESRYINDTLAWTNGELRELKTSPVELWNSIRKMLWFQDEPVHTMTAAVGYQLMELVAGRGIRVVLNGQGADETIGGYSSFFGDYWRELMARGQFSDAVSEINAYTHVHGGRPGPVLRETAAGLIAAVMNRSGLYRALADRRYERRVKAHPWFTPDLTAYLRGTDRPRGLDRLNAVLKRSVHVAPLPLYLRIEDRNSMAHSVEARLPFMDYRLVSFLFRLPANWKIRGPWNKFVLREGMRNRIPESVRARPDKMGFPTSGKQWFAGDLYEPIADLVSSQAVRQRGIYNTQQVIRDLARHRRGEIDVYEDLFHLAEFEMVAEFLQNDSVKAGDGQERVRVSTSSNGLRPAASGA